MHTMHTFRGEGTVNELLGAQLQPMVRSIDADGVYPKSVIKELFRSRAYSPGKTEENGCLEALHLIEKVSEVCGSTGFTVWCHTAAMHYIRNGESDFLKSEVLPLLKNGTLLGGTGLSNPMKYYAGLEPLRLKAEPAAEGYHISGALPFISNLGTDHWFGIIAEVNPSKRIMALIPCHADRLTMEIRENFLGLNGTATYSCKFDNVQVSEKLILSSDADQFVKKIRPGFILSQIGLSLGLTRASIDCMKRLKNKQNGANRYLPVQPEDLEKRWTDIRQSAYRLAQTPDNPAQHWEQQVLRTRLDAAYLALDAAQAEFLHCGGTGYIRLCDTSRRLRESHFIAVVTPAIKHIEKMLKG